LRNRPACHAGAVTIEEAANGPIFQSVALKFGRLATNAFAASPDPVRGPFGMTTPERATGRCG
jgi:hypothetical protein